MENKTLLISPAPHAKRGRTINHIMIDMIIALLPIIYAGVSYFGNDAVKVLVTATISAVVAEMLWNKFVKKTVWLTDLSPIVTGLTLGLIMPNRLPIWIVAVGSVFAIIFVKMFFGGLGQNIMNPAAASKAFLIASWGTIMVTTSKAGNIGETSVLAIVIGGLYLAFRGVISLRAPFMFIASSAIMYMVLGETATLPGAFFFAAFFMATDYATTPMTRVGQYIFGLACGILSAFIAIIGGNSDAPYYAIIILNLFAPMIEYFTTKRVKIKEVA